MINKNILLFTFFFSGIFANPSFSFIPTPEQKQQYAKSIRDAEDQIKENIKRHEIIESYASLIKEAEINNAKNEEFNAFKNFLMGKGSFKDLINARQKAKSIEKIADGVAFMKAESFLNATGFVGALEFLEKQKKSKTQFPEQSHEHDSIRDALLILD